MANSNFHLENTSQNNKKQKSASEILYSDERRELLRDISGETIKKAWFTISHLLLQSGCNVADMACYDGAMTYTMAVLKPDLNFIGVDKNSSLINKARKTFIRPNLEYMVGNIDGNSFEPNSLDGIIDSFVLHEKYSGSSYNDDIIRQSLTEQLVFLKNDGLLFIRDYAMPDPEKFVLIELPDIKSNSDNLSSMSEADLLIWFSESARPRQSEGCGGFYLEELPARFPNTRLFRLPHKWAYEFLMRKDNRAKWETELPKEYTFYTDQDYRRTLRNMGARVLYTSPHWDDDYIRKNFEDKFRLFDEDGNYIGNPATSFIALAQKTPSMKSLILHEKRISKSQNGTITLSSVKNKKTGRIMDVLSRGLDLFEVIPYRITEKGRIKIFLHKSRPRGLVNAIPRAGKQIDGKRWSGHMTEAITVDSEHVKSIKPDDFKAVVKFSQRFLGLKPLNHESFIEKGPGHYPDPAHIDERIETCYLKVRETKKTPEPREYHDENGVFSSKGKIIEYDAQDVLNAITVGLLPNSRLETQILFLFDKLKKSAESWVNSPLSLKEQHVENVISAEEIMEEYTKPTDEFKDCKGSAGQYRIVESIFVDEGQKPDGGITGLASNNIQFAISEEETINSAVVLALTKDLNGEVMAGVIKEFMPIPERYKGNGTIITAPILRFPKNVENIEQARKFIADQYEVPIENVCRMGEGFFAHIGITPHKVYPFAVANMLGHYDGFAHGVTNYAPIVDIWKLNYWDNHDSFMKVVAQAYQQFCCDSEFSLNMEMGMSILETVSTPISVASFEAKSISHTPMESKPVIIPTPANIDNAFAPSPKSTKRNRSSELNIDHKLKRHIK